MRWERFVILSLLGCVAAFVVDTAATNLPRQAHRMRSPKTSVQCASMRAGLSRSDVLKRLSEDYPPHLLFEVANEITFSRLNDGTCVVRFDAEQRVVRADFAEPQVVGFPD